MILVVPAIIVGDFDHDASRALWSVALSSLLIAIALTFRRPYNALLAALTVAGVALVVYVIAFPRWLKISFAVAVWVGWIWVYVVSPLQRAGQRSKARGHS